MKRLVLVAVIAASLPSHGEDLAAGSGRDLVQGHCSGCHSLALVTAQRGDRQFWLDTIRWMQEKHNLWLLPEAHERAILDYLASHYADSEWGRRPALAAHLLPEQ